MTFLEPLQSWTTSDTWIVVIGALAAMACSLPGCFLLLRQQSMMGDAISHTSLLGIVAAFFASHWLVKLGVISEATEPVLRHMAMCLGAVIVGVLSAWMAESLQKLGNVESSAALGVVFTSLFALGLLLIRAIADDVHIDPDCVLYGTIETSVLETIGNSDVPRAVAVNGIIFVFNLTLTVMLFKELRLSAFDPALANTLGISANTMHYGLMGVTAMTLVAAFESVGSILVVAMLIIPAATAFLLTKRLTTMIGVSLLIGVLSSVLGHVSALTLPPLIFQYFNMPSVRDASSAGMMAAAAGSLFLTAMLLGPRYGLFSQLWHRLKLQVRIAGEDLLGRLYRYGESVDPSARASNQKNSIPQIASQTWLSRLAIWSLRRRGWVEGKGYELHLTEQGRETARQLVRSHRLWESYLAKHFVLGESRFHESAEQVEHFIDGDLLAELDHDLDRPGVDPHGRAIPGS